MWSSFSWSTREKEENLLLLGLLGEKDGLDVGEDTTLGDGDTREKLVQLLVITDGELEMSGDDSGLLVVTGSVASQLEDLSSEVLKDSSQVDGSTSTHALSIVAFAQETVDTSNGELKSRAAGSALGLSLRLSSFATARHDVCLLCERERKFQQRVWLIFSRFCAKAYFYIRAPDRRRKNVASEKFHSPKLTLADQSEVAIGAISLRGSGAFK